MYNTQVYLYQQTQLVLLNDYTNSELTSVRWAPVYAKDLKLHKGTDNVLTFRFQNQDQKPVSLVDTTVTFRLINREGVELIMAKDLEMIDAVKGKAKVYITEAELDQVDPQRANYSLERKQSSSLRYDPVFVGDNAGGRGVVEIEDSIMPRHVESRDVSIPTYWDGTPSSGGNNEGGNNAIQQPSPGGNAEPGTGQGGGGSSTPIVDPDPNAGSNSGPGGGANNGVGTMTSEGEDAGEGVDTGDGVANPIVDPDGSTPGAGAGGGGVSNPIVDPDEGAGAGQGGGGVANPIVDPDPNSGAVNPDGGVANPIIDLDGSDSNPDGGVSNPIADPDTDDPATDSSTEITHYSSIFCGNDQGLITLQYSYEGYDGTIQIEGAVDDSNFWYDIGDVVTNSTTNGIGYINIEGYHPFIRVKMTHTTGDLVSIKIR